MLTSRQAPMSFARVRRDAPSPSGEAARHSVAHQQIDNSNNGNLV